MRKAEKIELDKTVYGLGLTQCEVHNLPLIHHLDDFGEGCWDCPVAECPHHIHQFKRMPWDLIDMAYANVDPIFKN